MAEKFLREQFGAEVCDHHIFAICSDGDLMEGVASEAASIAGHLAARPAASSSTTTTRSRSTARPTSSFSQEDVAEALRGLRLAHAHGRRRQRPRGDRGRDPRRHRRGGAADADQPASTVIGYGSPRAGTRNAHSDPMPDEQVRATKEALGWDPDAQFLVPDEVYEHWRDPRVERGAAAQAEWQARVRRVGAPRTPSSPRSGATPGPASRAPGFADALPVFDAGRPGRSRRAVAASEVMQAFGPFVPTMVGGAADLVHSTFTAVRGRRRRSRPSTPAATSPGACASTGWARRSTASRCTAGS